ncbi:MAG: CaiB/BaiF CoA-transferase family protein, partial [Acinetobacter pittii]
IKKMIVDTDILVENMRPGALEKLGLDWETLKSINPKLTFVRISGYGQSGPYKDKPGFGAIGEAMGGIRYTTGSQDSAPARVGVSLGDSLASLHAVIGALMSIVNIKTNNGNGQIVDVSLAESVFNIMESVVPEYDLHGFIRERSGGSLPGIAPSNTYRTKNNAFVVIAGNSDPIFKRLMHVIGREDLANRHEFEHNDGRAQQSDLLDAAIESWSRQHSIDEVLQLLEQAEVPSGRIYSVADMVNDPHFNARDMLLSTELPDGQVVKMPGIVPKLSETPGQVKWRGPELGEHTESVLKQYGYQAEDIESLRVSGVVQ